LTSKNLGLALSESAPWDDGVSQIPNVALIVMPEIVYTDTLILGTLSLSEFSISIGIRLLFGENHFRFNFTADLQNSERKKSKKDKKKSCDSQRCPCKSTFAAGYWLRL